MVVADNIVASEALSAKLAEFLTVKAHVVAEHVLSLKSHERGADDQRDGDQELQAHKQVPEHTPLGA